MSYLPVALGTTLAHEEDWGAESANGPAAPVGASISSSSWVVYPSGKGVTAETPSTDGLTTQTNVVTAADAQVGAYMITNVVAFSDGTTDRRSFAIRVANFAEAL